MAKAEVRINAKPEKPYIKGTKKKIRKRLDDLEISLKEISEHEGCTYSYQCVKKAFSADDFYWNQHLVDLAQNMIEEKKTVLQ
ncbi:hypothetical protein [Chitinophaga sancti]|uniref:Uncharacterized protein n=1 Tax=Chitinophaga sancti TaxID=1004 RepID=A0A1K1M0Z3_9BACT|nr:hypothetical protein [Chitinophaga sancti]WQD64715.1 hypothetical protein U0033_09935 [Chitinophaga sancti]WQG89663.1 hypothetical protein SR876_32540 [Chitinophaga sancti]SFW16785.1 hypothetical protein SAMN05661012_00358 [Chitinophaga sancti]